MVAWFKVGPQLLHGMTRHSLWRGSRARPGRQNLSPPFSHSHEMLYMFLANESLDTTTTTPYWQFLEMCLVKGFRMSTISLMANSQRSVPSINILLTL